MRYSNALTRSKDAESLLDVVKAVDVDAIFAERDGEYGLASAFGHLHAQFIEARRKFEIVVRDLISTEAALESLRYAAEKVFADRDMITDEAPYERLYSAADAVLQMIKAGWSHEQIAQYTLKDEEIDEGRIIPKSEYCFECGGYKDSDRKQEPLCELCQNELVRVR